MTIGSEGARVARRPLGATKLVGIAVHRAALRPLVTAGPVAAARGALHALVLAIRANGATAFDGEAARLTDARRRLAGLGLDVAERAHRAFEPFVVDGVLPIAEFDDNGVSYYVVVHGDERGRIWEVDGGYSPAASPLCRPLNFREWYALWLDGSNASG